MEDKTLKKEELQGDDKILVKQIEEIAEIYESISSSVRCHFDEVHEETLKIIDMLKSGEGEDEIYKYLSRWQEVFCSEAKKQLDRKNKKEAAKKIAELYTVQSGLSSTEPLGLEEELQTAWREIRELMEIYTEERSQDSTGKREKTKELIAGYDMDSLIYIAGELADFKGNRWFTHKYTKEDLKYVLNIALEERRKRLNENFQWTDEKRERLIFLNNRIMDATIKCLKKIEEIDAALESQTRAKDSFFMDYEICAEIYVYPEISGNRRSAGRIEKYLAEDVLLRTIYHEWYEDTDNAWTMYKKALSFEERNGKVFNWNDGKLKESERTSKEMCEQFKDVDICFALHRMLEYHDWSYSDILSAERIYIDVKINQQYHEDVHEAR